MAKSVRYPIGIQHFPKLREGDFVYIDKTMYIKKLLDCFLIENIYSNP
ncbi:MAG: AAA family ATPase [Muribaculaceae bacterium]|nr:AAA family ATPase [Muribaculaceae bacterium]